MAYLLDTNVFIEAKGLHYGMDFCPGFWDWLVRAAKKGVIRSIRQVEDELQDDELREWLKKLGSDFFAEADLMTMPALAQVSEWVQNTDYLPGAKSTFLSAADFHLIAHAVAGGHTVITHEQFQATKHVIKIPNVCTALRVKYARTHEMLRREKARFILKPSKK
jgi:hypothetical protein